MANADGMPQSDTTGTARKDDDIVTEARSRYELCSSNEERTEALEDLRFLNGDQWDADAVRQRQLDNRPCLTFNNLPSILHQVTNDARQNKQSVHVAPVDDDADPKVAEVIEGLIRHIEYDSKADAAYDTAVASAAQIGFGFFYWETAYADEMSFDQDIKIRRVRNPFTVYLDPNAVEADGSDAEFGFISTKVSNAEFKRSYPDASTTAASIGTSTGDNDRLWFGEDYTRVSRYYRVEQEPDTLHLLPDGTTILASDKSFAAVMKVVASVPDWSPISRPTTRRKVMCYKVTGADVLESTEIPCRWIPIFPVYGDEIDIDGKVTRSGLIRNAKDPKKMENYWLTSATEEVAMRTRTPFIGALGQFENMEDDWANANTRNLPYLEYNPVSVNGSLAPAPSRQPPADVPTGYIQMAAIARDAVKATTSIYDAQLGNRSNEVSGLAIRARQQQGGLANFHFADNLTRAISHMARTIVDAIPRVYDAHRIVRVLGEDRKTATPVAINAPKSAVDPKTQEAIDMIENDLTVGVYDVTVSAGPGYNSLREEAVSAMVELASKDPQVMQVAGDLIVKNMDWPGAQEIAERLRKLLPPGMADDGDDDDQPMVQTPKGPMSVQQAGQLIAQLDQHAQQLEQQLQEETGPVVLARIQAESRERVAEITAQGKHDDTELAGMIQLLLAGQRDQFNAIESVRKQMGAIDEMSAQSTIAHAGAVAAAADPDHPAPSAEDAQAAAAPPPEPSAGSTAGAPDGAA